MSRTMQNCLLMLFTLCFLPMGTFAQVGRRLPPQIARRVAALKQLHDNALKTTSSDGAKAKHVKANDNGTFTTLHAFTGGADGGGPIGGVSLDASGTVYGSTDGQGVSGDYGTLYKIDTAGNYTVLYDFQNGTDGQGPDAPPLPPDGFGNMYGTAGGGAAGQGTLFQFIPGTSSFNLLDAFGTSTDATNGWAPNGLISDSADNLYGFTGVGGDFSSGNVYEAPSGNLANPTNLYSFTGNVDGGYPGYGTLHMDASGNLYGTTTSGGNDFIGNVYELSQPSSGGCPTNSYQNDSGWCETVLYGFDFPNDPIFPYSGVTMDASGNLYGTGDVGGSNNESGGVWKLTPVSPGGICPAGSNQDTGSNWCETVLYNFCSVINAGYSTCADGNSPEAGVVLDGLGNIYGVTQLGGVGTNNYGVLYEISASGQFTVLHSFNGSTDGAYPYGTPALSSSGTLYGTTTQGGSGPDVNSGLGTVWSYQLSQPQTITFTSFIPQYAKKNDTFTVTASATSGLPVALTASGPCTVPANSVSPAMYIMTSNTGTCSVIANQAGNNSYAAAPQISTIVTATASVTLITPTTSLTTNPTGITSAAFGGNFTVTATSNSTGVLTLTATPPSVCSISGTTVTMNSGTGNCVVEAKWKANEYFAAASATPLTIAAMPLTGTIDWTAPGVITYGIPLTATQLDASTNSNGKLVYLPKEGKVLAAGNQPLLVTLDATKDYTGTTDMVSLTVNQSTTTTAVNSTTVGSTYLKATVSFTTAGQFGGKLTGDVTVTATTGEFCKGSPASGTCTITFKRTSAGTAETLSAVYPGDANNTSSSGTGAYTVPTGTDN